MNKAELLKELTASGEIGVFRRTPTWERAFKAYNDTHGDKVSNKCGSCYRRVADWLKS